MTAPSELIPLTPARIADTRTGHGGVNRQLRPGERMRVKVAGAGGVPGSGATAVVANVTAVDATSPMYFTVYPGSTARPKTSNLNGGPGRPVPNLVVMAIGDDGYIDVFNSHGHTHCVVDVFGYFKTTGGDRFAALSPQRLFDTRTGKGIRGGKVNTGSSIDVQVAGNAGVPSSGATAVVLNLTVTEPESPGYLRMTPTGEPPAQTSNVNFFAGDTVPNLVICRIGTKGRITLTGVGQGHHVVADVFGYFGNSGDLMRATPPRRVLDTRIGLGSDEAPIGPARTTRLAVTGNGVVPPGATAVVMNMTATNVTAPSYITVWPAGEEAPGTSNLNLMPGQTIANLVICRIGEDGAVEVGNPRADCDVVADVLGYFED
jgi:hypothetical protein